MQISLFITLSRLFVRYAYMRDGVYLAQVEEAYFHFESHPSFLRSFGENREIYLRKTGDTLDADQIKLVGFFLLLHRECCLPRSCPVILTLWPCKPVLSVLHASDMQINSHPK